MELTTAPFSKVYLKNMPRQTTEPGLFPAVITALSRSNLMTNEFRCDYLDWSPMARIYNQRFSFGSLRI